MSEDHKWFSMQDFRIEVSISLMNGFSVISINVTWAIKQVIYYLKYRETMEPGPTFILPAFTFRQL